jgi:hypothetical protein
MVMLRPLFGVASNATPRELFLAPRVAWKLRIVRWQIFKGLMLCRNTLD